MGGVVDGQEDNKLSKEFSLGRLSEQGTTHQTRGDSTGLYMLISCME